MHFRKFTRIFLIVAIVLVQIGFVASALTTEVQASNTLSAVAVPTLPAVGTIGGKVTAQKGGKAISNVTVTLYNANKNVVKVVKTNAQGQYQFTGLDQKTKFYIGFAAAGYKTEFFNNKPKLNQATSIQLSPKKINFTANAALAK